MRKGYRGALTICMAGKAALRDKGDPEFFSFQGCKARVLQPLGGWVCRWVAGFYVCWGLEVSGCQVWFWDVTGEFFDDVGQCPPTHYISIIFDCLSALQDVCRTGLDCVRRDNGSL